MKNPRLHIISLLFIAIALLPLAATGFLQVAQAVIKAGRTCRLQQQPLVQVAVPAATMVWEEAGRELWVGDRLFDVASSFTADGNCYLTGVYDDKETDVAGSLVHVLLSANGNHLLQLIFLLQCFTGGALLFGLAPPLHRSKLQNVFCFLQFPSPFAGVLSPPPKG